MIIAYFVRLHPTDCQILAHDDEIDVLEAAARHQRARGTQVRARTA